MKTNNKGISEIEATLQEIGHKIEELVQKGKDAGSEVKEEEYHNDISMNFIIKT